MNIGEIYVQLTELIQSPFDRTDFPFRLLEFYNAPKATLTKLRSGTQNKGEQAGDVLWSRKLFFRPAAQGQAAATLDALKEAKAAKTHKPRFLLATDGTEVAAYDVKADDTLHIDYAKLNDRFDFFLPLAGVEKYEAVAESQADIKAAGRLAKLHDEIERHNPDWLAPEKRHPLNQFLTRALFCMFAQSTGSFSPNLFVKTISEFGGPDGENLQSLLKQIFDVMNVPEDQRAGLPAHIGAFPYVNGGLFAESTEVPAFNKRAKRMLVEAAQLDWKEINPDIFGSMIQAVVDTDMRGDLGLHYTSVPNIMKVLQPLFLMSLEEEFERARGHREERSLLRKLLTRISKIRVFDPACGSGNFLIIAYRELRTLEMRIFQRLDEISGGTMTWREQSGVRLSNFYGIELADFAAETAKLSLWIAEYQMNQRFKNLFGEAPKSFPLKEGGHIVCNNALRIDWLEVCPPPTKTVQKEKVFDLSRVEKVHATETVLDDEVETYIVGNPPYAGSVYQTANQKRDMEHVFEGRLASFRDLDYVASFYLRAADYCSSLDHVQAAFVSTNSICQGEQVAMLWPSIFEQGIEIGFAHQSFKWKNNATNNAAVICVVVGLRRQQAEPKLLFTESHSKKAHNIGPYLLEMGNVVVTKRSSPLSALPRMVKGNQPSDDGNFIFSSDERRALLSRFPHAERFLRRFYGSQEFIKGIERWCLWLERIDLAEAELIAPIAERIKAVERFRLDAQSQQSRDNAGTPFRFAYAPHQDVEAIIVARVASERRHYIPVGFMPPEAIISDNAYAIYEIPVHVFSVLSSRLHAIWALTVGGRMKTDYRYSNTLVYNNFPLPPLDSRQVSRLEELAWTVIAERESNPGRTIAWLYDPKSMPQRLLEAHRAIDDALEKIYIGRAFRSDSERLEHLFKLYAEMMAGREREAVNA